MRAQVGVGLVALVIGCGVLYNAQVGLVTLEGTPGGVTCSYRRSLLGVVTTRRADVRGVTRAEVDLSPQGSAETGWHDDYQVVLTTADGEVRPLWLRWHKTADRPGKVFLDTGAFPGVHDRINALVGQKGSRESQRSWSPALLLIGSGAVAFGLLSLWPLFTLLRRRRPAGTDGTPPPA